MKARTLFAVLALVGAVGAATAAGRDARGWTEGKPAGRAAEMLAGPQKAQAVNLPRELAAKIAGPTVLFYFSPTCPHCRAVAPEVTALADRLKGVAPLLGVASGGSSEGEILEFRASFGAQWPIVHDTSRDIVAALGARSTPSALLVKPDGKGKFEVLDLWYPYLPGFDALIEGRAKGDLFSVFRPNEYLGDNVCGSCHDVEYASVGLQHHSVAWRTLVRKEKHTDAACTSCHVTGAGQPTGWDPADEHSALVNVGCEACHGPGGPHDGARAEPRESCATCHDEKHSIAFTVEKGLPLIDHYLADHLTDVEFTDRRRLLLDGEAPRDLLAFQDGKNLGAQACQSCHPEAYAHWKAGPHAAGMNSLVVPGKADDVGCVRCHATATETGAPPTSMDGFRVAEGVGCESCHGPGEAHVAAGGGTENIERLGDDCPVCVIEAVCTSCHVESWDPEWDLETDLPKVHHRAPPAP